MADFNTEVLGLSSFTQNAIAVYPAVLDIVDTISNNKHICGIYELPIAYVREKIRLHNGNMTFSFNHNT